MGCQGVRKTESSNKNQRATTKGQNGLGTFSHFFGHFSTHFQSFSEFFLQDIFLELRSFTTVVFQRDEKRPKEEKKKKDEKTILHVIVGVLRGKTIRGNTTCNSERKMALWEGLWEGLWKPLKTSKNLWEGLWKPLKPSLSEVLSEILSEADFPLRTSQACCP